MALNGNVGIVRGVKQKLSRNYVLCHNLSRDVQSLSARLLLRYLRARLN
jgi:hypothetical protein